MITPEYLLTPAELDVLWHELELGRLPYPLDVPSVGGTADERARMRRTLLDERPDLVGDQRLADFLRLLAEHEIAVDAVAHLERPVRAVAVSSGDRAVLAVIDSDRVGLLEIRPTALARSIVEVLPDGAAGPGIALSLRQETLDAAVRLYEDPPEDDDDPWGGTDLNERDALRQAGLSEQDAAQIAELAAGRVAGGQFGVSRWSQFRTERAGALITWFDTHNGRYLMVNENGWLSLSPTDNERIAARISSVLTTV
ncbi:ESX secretion-associated protein EspG [Lentzea sp. NBRC 105346]|uniref:ESX secretion-associated protein EspG n=1 Tax=Lentzea sp. NBRC 105346 TaxID=3032205 RepID=UPI0024A25B03|nr:ESX secretion-associated protein EspG [Lentzea sp. NBRC 105346]GLZ30984.1 ESX secretion-associated protein EspG [Lentzea sp. NBRC 105346]